MARILQVCNTDFYLSRFLKPLVLALVAQGHEVDCVCEGEVIDRKAFGSSVRLHAFEYPRTSSAWQFIVKTLEMRRLIRAGNYDCVNSHNRNSSIVGRLAAWLARVPVNIYTAHGFYFHDDQSPLKRRATILLEALLARITDYTLSQSREDVQYMTQARLIRADRIECIGNGIDTARFAACNDRAKMEHALGLSSDCFRVCSIGRLVKGKGFADLLQAFSKFSRNVGGTELLIVGGNIDQDISSFAQGFADMVSDLGLQNSVRVTGLTEHVEDYLCVSDLFVLPSYREGLPRALLEAMSVGVCAVATNIRGCREVIEDGRTGFLFEPRDTKRLSALMQELFDAPGLRARVADSGRQRVRTDFSEPKYINAQVTAINRLLDSAKTPTR